LAPEIADAAEARLVAEARLAAKAAREKRAAEELVKMQTKACDWISKNCKGSINRQFPEQARNMTLGQIKDAANAGEWWGKKAWKLLTGGEYQK